MPPPSSQGTDTASTIACDAGPVLDAAAAGAVEIDQVQALGPLFDPMPGHRGRIVAKHGFPLVITLLEPNALAASKINRWPDLHHAGPVLTLPKRRTAISHTQIIPASVRPAKGRPESLAAGVPRGRLASQRRPVSGRPLPAWQSPVQGPADGDGGRPQPSFARSSDRAISSRPPARRSSVCVVSSSVYFR